MALIEVEQSEFETLRKQAADSLPSKQLLDKLGANPKTRAQVLALMKEVNPNLVIPELDAAKPVLDKVAALEEKLAAKEKAEAEKEAKAAEAAQKSEIEKTIKGGRKKLSEAGWTKEGIEGVEKLMQERGLADYEAAAALFEKENPKEESTVPSNFTKSWDLFEAPADNELIKKAVSMPKGAAQERALKTWQNTEINKWFAEQRGQHRVRV